METEKQEVKIAGFPLMLLLIGLTVSSLFLYFFSELAEEMLTKNVQTFDRAVTEFLRSIQSNTLDTWMIFITELGSVWFLTTFSLVIVLFLWFKYKDKWSILFFALAVGGGGILTKVLKHVYERGRPSINPEIDAVGFSFPSGHSMGSLIFYGFMIYLIVISKRSKMFKWTVSSLAVILFLLIGISRIYLGAHFPSDVIAGQLAGTVWLFSCIMTLEWIKWQTQNNIRPVRSIRKVINKLDSKT